MTTSSTNVNFDATITVACTSIATLLLSECKSPSSHRPRLPSQQPPPPFCFFSIHFPAFNLLIALEPPSSMGMGASSGIFHPTFKREHTKSVRNINYISISDYGISGRKCTLLALILSCQSCAVAGPISREWSAKHYVFLEAGTTSQSSAEFNK